MKIAIAQINSVVGDFPGNAKKILNAYREGLEGGAEMVVTPELSLAGYSSQDLIFKSGYVDKCLQALDYLAGEVGEIPLIVGYLDKNEKSHGKAFHNAAAFLQGGSVKERVFKSLLPTYDVFDERRYFEPSDERKMIEWGGKKIGLTICEDIWTEEYFKRPLYLCDPVGELMAEGAEMIINVSASPFHGGKVPRRRQLLSEVAREHRVPVVYCNLVGGNDQLIFDGHSMLVSKKGRVAVQLQGFSEEVRVVDSDSRDEPELKELKADELNYRALVLGLRDYVHKCGFQKVCLGLSGGIDSALTAVLAVAALGAENVHGITMPSEFSSAGSVDDSFALAKNLGIACDQVPIGSTYEAAKSAMTPIFAGTAEDVTEENMQARIRGLFLMAYVNKMGGMLLTTGNKSELAVGYCTMYGDMCGGLAILSDLPKTKVYTLSRWINRNEEIIPWSTIEKEPSAELRPNQRDQDSLPPYEILDDILELYVEKQLSVSDILAQREYDEDVVRWVTRRVDLNEWKRHQAAPGLRVTSKAFGIGRRIPIVKKFPE